MLPTEEPGLFPELGSTHPDPIPREGPGQNPGPSQNGVIKLAGPLLRRVLLPDELPHLFLEIFGNFLHAVEIPSVLEGGAKQFLFRLPPDHEITIRT
jgi:hypothetical protein